MYTITFGQTIPKYLVVKKSSNLIYKQTKADGSKLFYKEEHIGGATHKDKEKVGRSTQVGGSTHLDEKRPLVCTYNGFFCLYEWHT